MTTGADGIHLPEAKWRLGPHHTRASGAFSPRARPSLAFWAPTLWVPSPPFSRSSSRPAALAGDGSPVVLTRGFLHVCSPLIELTECYGLRQRLHGNSHVKLWTWQLHSAVCWRPHFPCPPLTLRPLGGLPTGMTASPSFQLVKPKGLSPSRLLFLSQWLAVLSEWAQNPTLLTISAVSSLVPATTVTHLNHCHHLLPLWPPPPTILRTAPRPSATPFLCSKPRSCLGRKPGHFVHQNTRWAGPPSPSPVSRFVLVPPPSPRSLPSSLMGLRGAAASGPLLCLFSRSGRLPAQSRLRWRPCHFQSFLQSHLLNKACLEAACYLTRKQAQCPTPGIHNPSHFA